MLKIRKSPFFKKMFFSVLVVVFFVSCKQLSEEEKLKRYLEVAAATGEADSVSATQLLQLPGKSDGGSSMPSLIGGTPRVVKEGFCGDGIINGTNEDCDKQAITNPNCSELGGISGTIRCSENCLYDLSDCITPAVDREIGGIAETCKCNCDNSACMGGCGSAGAVGQSQCRYDCENSCTCKCEGKLEAQLERCRFRCVCTLDSSGTPQCNCNMEECEFLTTIAPNIGSLVGRHGKKTK